MSYLGSSGGGSYLGGGGSSNNVASDIANLLTRLDSTGASTSLDDRNWFEKAVNLPTNQNAFMDVLDLLGRPLQGINNMIHDSNTFKPIQMSDSFWNGFSGKKQVTGSDLMQDWGIGSPVGKFVGGLAWDVLADPVNLIPGAAFAKTAEGIGKGITGLGRGGLKLADTIMPGLKLPERLDDVRNGLGYMFRPSYMPENVYGKGATEDLANDVSKANATIDYHTSKNADEILRQVKKTGVNAGNPIAREMEKDLSIDYDPEEFVSQLFKNKPNQTFKANRMDGEPQSIVNSINSILKNSDEVKDFKLRQNKVIDAINDEIDKIHQTHNIPQLVQDVRAGNATKSQQRTYDKLLKLNEKKVAAKQRVADAAGGIKIKPLQTGKGFTIHNPLPGLTRKATRMMDVVEEISPKMKFDDIALKRGIGGTVARNMAEDLLRTGQVKVTKGTPEHAIAQEVKNIFGKNAEFVDAHGKPIPHATAVSGHRNYYIRLNKKSPYNGHLLDDIEFTDRIQNVHFNRPDRQYINRPNATPHEEEVMRVAGRLTRMNADIAQLAKEKGVSLEEMAGYMTHILSEAEKEAMVKASSNGKAYMGGNKAVVSSRELKGSVEDINDLLGKEKFNPNAYFATAVGQQRLINYIVAESFKNEMLQKWGRIYNGGPIGKTEAVIRPSDFKFFKNDSGGMELAGKGDEYVVPISVKNALDNLKGRITDEGIKSFAKTFDKAQGLWKAFALFSPAFHARNIMGAEFNMWIGGMRTTSIAKYTADAIGDLLIHKTRLSSYKMVDEFKRMGLGGMHPFINEFKFAGKDQEEVLRKAIQNGDKEGIQKLLAEHGNPFKSSQQLGQFIDETHRLAMFKWLKDKGLSSEQAAKKVKETLYDYNELTPFEKNVMKRIVPFYTWMRKNVEFMFKSFVNDPRKFSNANKALDNAADVTGLDQGSLPDWLQNGMPLAVSGNGKGKGELANINLPMADLNKLTSPISLLGESLSPFLKVPLEHTANYNTFLKKPIEEYEGQTKNFLGMDMPIKTAYDLSQLGLLRNLDNILQKPGVQSYSTGFIRDFDNQKSQTSKQYEQLKQLEAMLKDLKHQGVKVPTLRELGGGL